MFKKRYGLVVRVLLESCLLEVNELVEVWLQWSRQTPIVRVQNLLLIISKQ